MTGLTSINKIIVYKSCKSTPRLLQSKLKVKYLIHGFKCLNHQRSTTQATELRECVNTYSTTNTGIEVTDKVSRRDNTGQYCTQWFGHMC